MCNETIALANYYNATSIECRYSRCKFKLKSNCLCSYPRYYFVLPLYMYMEDLLVEVEKSFK